MQPTHANGLSCSLADHIVIPSFHSQAPPPLTLSHSFHTFPLQPAVREQQEERSEDEEEREREESQREREREEEKRRKRKRQQLSHARLLEFQNSLFCKIMIVCVDRGVSVPCVTVCVCVVCMLTGVRDWCCVVVTGVTHTAFFCCTISKLVMRPRSILFSFS